MEMTFILALIINGGLERTDQVPYEMRCISASLQLTTQLQPRGAEALCFKFADNKGWYYSLDKAEWVDVTPGAEQ